MKKHGIAAIVLLVFAVAGIAAANDTVMEGVGGTVRQVNGESKCIRMVREWVRVDVYERTHTVNAQFIFKNECGALKVKMGFPERSWGPDSPYTRFRIKSDFDGFQTWVDGKLFKAKRVLSDCGPGIMECEAFWVKTVPFKKNQQRTVRVKYTARNGDNSLGYRLATYDFTGGNWLGNVGSSKIVYVFHLKGIYFIEPYFPKTKFRGNTLSAQWNDWEAETDVYAGWIPTFENARMLFTYENHEKKTACPNGAKTCFILDNPSRGKTTIDKNYGFIMPDVLKRKNLFLVGFSSIQSILKSYDLLEKPEKDPGLKETAKTFVIPAADKNKRMTFYRDKNYADVGDGTKKQLEIPLSLKAGYTIFVPLEPIAEVFGLKIIEDETAKTVYLKKY